MPHGHEPPPRVWYASLILCAVCILFFIAQQIWGSGNLILDAALAGAEPWRLVTAIFCHAGVAHLLSNLFALGLFGLILEARIGSRRLFLLFLAAGVGINAIIAAFGLYDRSLGASGAIFAILGGLVILRPRMTIWVDMIPLPMFLAGMVWAVQDALGVFVPSGVANLAHLAGLAIGLLMGVVWRREFADPPARKRPPKDPRLEKDLDAWEREHMPAHKRHPRYGKGEGGDDGW
jgi:uncharacterized protein